MRLGCFEDGFASVDDLHAAANPQQRGARAHGVVDEGDLSAIGAVPVTPLGLVALGGAVQAGVDVLAAHDDDGVRVLGAQGGALGTCLLYTSLMKDGAPVSDTELLSRIARYRRIFRTTKGGITLSGGEVLMQPQFAKRILMGAKEMGVHTCIDTSGFLGANCDDEMLDAIDLVLLDVKSGNEETYKKATGRALAPTIEFGDRIAARGGATRIWIRFVLVPGLTDDPENVRQVGEIVSRWKDVIDRIEVLPFHQLGKDKWHSLGLDYQLEDTKAPTPEATEEVRNYFRSLGFEVH